MQFRKQLLLGAVLSAAAATVAVADSQVTIIQTGDFHGHLTPRPNLRSNADYPGQMVGGLARVATAIKTIQEGKGGAGNTLVLHTGDTIQGSGEALYTRGQAVVDVVDMLGIDAYAPGNWDFVYGPERFKELFAVSLDPNLPTLPEQAQGRVIAPPFGTRWGGVVSNLYITSPNPSAPKDPASVGTAQDSNVSQAEYDTYAQWYADHGQRVLPPYLIRYVNGVKIGILGCTTSRGPQVVGKWVTAGLDFTDCAIEAPMFAEELRTTHGVQIIVLLSEIEIGRNIQLIKNKITKPEQHIDVILNSDMHEEVLQPIEVIDAAGNKTWIIEAGQDGTLVGEITLSVHEGQVIGMNHVPHRIDDRIVEDVAVANKVAQVRALYNEGFNASITCNSSSPYWNSFTEATCLSGPLSDVVGNTEVALHRSNYSHENMAAVVEGSSHDFIADAMRWWTKSDLATVRGFRFGTHVAPGPITRNDLFHFAPIGPRIGKASRISANQLRNQLDNSSSAVFSSDPNSPVTPRPNYNNAYGTNNTLANTVPGMYSGPAIAGITVLSPLVNSGLPVKGLAGNTLGWGGGWLFAYSADGLHMNLAPYYIPTSQAAPEYDAATNSVVAVPLSDTSRARSLTMKMPCKYLPPVERATANNGAACNMADTVSRYSTTLTNATNGVWTPNWSNTYVAQGETAKNAYLLNPDGWVYMQGTPNQPTTVNAVARPFQAGLFTAAGFFYAQSPNTINNCSNCYPTGLSKIVGDAEAAYVLPVNVDVDGNAALDANGNPKYVRDATTNAVIMENGKPKLEGAPIDLTTVIEKYLASLGTVTAANLPLNRIGLVNNDGSGPITLPDFTGTLGFPVMQPLCGTVGKTAATTLNCP